ncbi:HipA domain-containing protein [Phocoenobacter skyensis]|uniref:HipA domain-containing protein n=1 Tax=Phocoenobacter skyensis TaxID=97481 RepID=A0A1H7YEY1_9PAST|nr:HipA domain-containing protein [Pasteurella skyensis]MDP8079740.1 HipA domain-containing protein [Pasteurella skyensis]MDP8085685.1 HipA domain-containing protein [Pasteurella skyensis]MDP8170948.1 HipA domain-containing protein [Pasteurella skyensis]MDP8175194.1 HipA domain-containing protein [Pasteurella skyensis]MDP8185454.1 HipA domain-containing protein [Pasteurella skyensis]
MVTRLNVFMNGESVGVFTRTSAGAYYFSYVESWFNSPQCRPISLSMPLRFEAYQGKEVINFFDNLLPDNPQIRERIATRFQAETKQPFDLLAKIGRDATGAITLLPEGDELSDYKTIQAEVLNETRLAEIIQGYQQNAPLGMLDSTQDFRISIAGAQEKTALLFHNNQWQLPQGLTPTTHIIKLPIGEIKTAKHTLDLSKSVDNELICLKLCQAFGLNTAESDLLTVRDLKVLAVKRFDRRLASSNDYYLRLPHEDFCQVFGLSSAQKYENDGGVGIKEIMQKLLYSNDTNDRHSFMQTQFIFWLLGAIDGHSKNFSVAIERQGRYRLSPVYDVISAYPMLGVRGWHKRDLQLAMSLSSTKKGKKWYWHSIRAEHYLTTAKIVGFSPNVMKQSIEYICDTAQQTIDKVGNELPVMIDETVRDQIFTGVLKAVGKVVI